MQHSISHLGTKAKRCFPQKTERPHLKSGSSWSQQPARGSPSNQHVTEIPKEHSQIQLCCLEKLTPREAKDAPD